MHRHLVTALCSEFFLSYVVLQSHALNTGMPPLELAAKRHTSDFRKKTNHPTSYEENPKFLGPLVLPVTVSTSDNRTRIKNFYIEANDDTATGLKLPKQPLNALKPSAPTDVIIKTIMNQFAYYDAPVDAKELAESVEFYLRCRKRLLGAAKKRNAKYRREALAEAKAMNASESESGRDKASIENAETSIHADIRVYDLCSGHGLTGMLFAACNPPSNDRIVKAVCIDLVEPPSHSVLRNLIAEVCPWVEEYNTIEFSTTPLESFEVNDLHSLKKTMEDPETEVALHPYPICPIVIATHACGKLTDLVLNKAVDMKACAIAAMPCCYTGTDKGVPYGIKRAFGVAWAADIRRTNLLDGHNYHTDYSTIPSEITPLNRIIVAEDRS